jgi:hypothetical protein
MKVAHLERKMTRLVEGSSMSEKKTCRVDVVRSPLPHRRYRLTWISVGVLVEGNRLLYIFDVSRAVVANRDV